MIDLTFTPGMREVLRAMKGKAFRSYEYREFWRTQEAGVAHGEAPGEFRLNLGRSAVHVTCDLLPVMVHGVMDDGARLACEEVGLKTPFDYLNAPPTEEDLRQLRKIAGADAHPYADGPIRAYLVGERVESVELVTDRVDFAGEGAEIDMALVVRCARGTYTFARGNFGDEMVYVTADPDPDAPPAVRPPERLWLQSAEQRERNRVERTVSAL